MNSKFKSFSHFFRSSHFYESIKVTIGVISPSLILAQFGKLELGILLSIGAMCVNIVDSPGPMAHRRNAMLITSPLLFLFTFLTCIFNVNIYLSGIYLGVCTFICSMLYVYGNRAASVGIAILLIVVLSLDNSQTWLEIFIYSSAILAGSIWYTILSYLFHKIRPYRFAQQTISEYILEIAAFLRIKADFYQPDNAYFENYNKLISKQIIITEKQNAIREILFTTRNIVKESTPEGRFLTQVFRDSVDLFEQLMSTQYNYVSLRESFQKSNILYKFHEILNLTALELDTIAYALNIGEIPKESNIISEKINLLALRINDLENEQDEYGYSLDAIFALKNILNNLKFIIQQIQVIGSYISSKKDKKFSKNNSQSPNLEVFLTRSKKINFSIFRENLNFKSNSFRFAIRFSIIMIVGFIISKLLNSNHSYWVLLSILVILKPAFSQTKQRNIHRSIGTLAGGLIGLTIIYYIHNQYALFFILIFCMLMAFSFLRTNYIVYVLFMTPYLFAAYSFLGIGNANLVKERIIDTFIGAFIAFIGTYILLPNWEYYNSKKYILKCLTAISDYFKEVSAQYTLDTFDLTKYKLARKEIYINLSNMASLVNNMFEEPKSKQLYIREIQQINSLMYLFSSYTASLFLFKKEQNIESLNTEEIEPLIQQIIQNINASIEVLELNKEITVISSKVIQLEEYNQQDGYKAVRDQLLTIQNLSSEIYKLSKKLG